MASKIGGAWDVPYGKTPLRLDYFGKKCRVPVLYTFSKMFYYKNFSSHPNYAPYSPTQTIDSWLMLS